MPDRVRSLAPLTLLVCALGCGSTAAERPAGTTPDARPAAHAPTARATAAPAGPTRWENPALACRIERDYGACIMARVDAPTASESELVLLIQSQRMAGDAEGSARSMRVYIERFRDSAMADVYAETLAVDPTYSSRAP